jgi:hypothetical protein
MCAAVHVTTWTTFLGLELGMGIGIGDGLGAHWNDFLGDLWVLYLPYLACTSLQPVVSRRRTVASMIWCSAFTC